MKREIMKIWVEALKSGEFEQCKGKLEKNGNYCALGVLSVLALVNGQCTYNDLGNGGRFDNKRFSLSYNVMKWAGIAQDEERYFKKSCQKVEIVFKGQVTTIAALNDRGMSFFDIAKIIKANWQHL